MEMRVSLCCNIQRIYLREDHATWRPLLYRSSWFQVAESLRPALCYWFSLGQWRQVDDSISETGGFSDHAKSVINDHTESRSTYGYTGYTYVPTQLQWTRPDWTAAS